VRITAKAGSAAEADELIAGVEKTIRERLGQAIYGADDETLENVTLRALAQRGWTLTVVEVNTGGELSRLLSETGQAAFVGGKILTALGEGQSLAEAVAAQMENLGASAALGLTARQAASAPSNGSDLGVDMVIVTPNTQVASTRTYGGHPKNVPAWGANNVLDLLRREISE